METITYVILTIAQLGLTLAGLMLFYRHEKRKILAETLPSLIQSVLNDVGESISEQINANFSTPSVKRAMSVLGKESGAVRTNAALQNKVADKVISENPIIARVLDYFDISPLEGLQLMNDPMFSGLIQKYAGQFLGGEKPKELRERIEFPL